MRRRPAILAAALACLSLATACLLWAAARPYPAYAHAELLDWRVTQAHADSGTQVPALQMRFGEELDPAFVHVQIFDRGSRPVAGTSAKVVANAPDSVLVTLPPDLARGTYGASWWVRAADGDTSQNSFYFSTGGPLDPLAMLPSPAVRDPATSPPISLLGTSVSALLRWAGLVAALFVAGGTFFMMFMWRPVARRGQPPGVDAALVHTLRVVCFEAAAALVFTSMLLLLLQAETARLPLLQPAGATQPLLIAPSLYEHQVPARAVGELLASSYGRVWSARCLLAVLVGILGLTLPLEAGRRRWHWWVLLVAGAAILLTFSLTAHGAVTPRARPAVAVDWTHLAAASIWLGALPALVQALRLLRRAEDAQAGAPDTSLASRLVTGFSTVALPAVAWLAVSGLYAYTVHVGSPALLLRTTYGITLTVKLGFFASLIVIGAVSRYVLLPRLRTASRNDAGSGFARSLPFELGLGLAVVVCAGLLLSLATAKDAWTAREQLGFFDRVQQNGVVMTLRTVDPSKSGGAIAVDVIDPRPGASASTASVTARLGAQQLALASIPVTVPGVQRFGTSGTGTALGTADSVSVEYLRGALPPVSTKFRLPTPHTRISTAAP